MLALSGNHRILLCTQPTDMRKSFDGLAAVVSQILQDAPNNGSVFVFINRRRTQMKCLYYESGGYCVWAKRLEQGQFALPRNPQSASKGLSKTEFLSLIEGLDLVIQKHRKRYK